MSDIDTWEQLALDMEPVLMREHQFHLEPSRRRTSGEVYLRCPNCGKSSAFFKFHPHQETPTSDDQCFPLWLAQPYFTERSGVILPTDEPQNLPSHLDAKCTVCSTTWQASLSEIEQDD